MRSLVSVILPTYNRAYVLKRAIDSVLAQTYENLELIVIDDGSTDGTQDLLNAYSDPRLKVMMSGKSGGGAAAARNRGLEAAQGEYIAFQDSDDEWLLEKLERQIAHLESHPKASANISGFLCLTVGFNSLRYRGATELWRNTFMMKRFCYGTQCSTPAWIVRHDKLKLAGPFDESMVCWEDWELSIRVDCLGGYVALDEPLHVSYDTRGSVKMNTSAFVETMNYMMRKHASYVVHSRRLDAAFYWLMGCWERECGRMATARKFLFQSILKDPTFLRPWLTIGRRAFELFGRSKKMKSL